MPTDIEADLQTDAVHAVVALARHRVAKLRGIGSSQETAIPLAIATTIAELTVAVVFRVTGQGQDDADAD